LPDAAIALTQIEDHIWRLAVWGIQVPGVGTDYASNEHSGHGARALGQGRSAGQDTPARFMRKTSKAMQQIEAGDGGTLNRHF
jgi:hypothetical protein